MTKEYYLKKDVAAQWRLDIREKVNNQAKEITELAKGVTIPNDIKLLVEVYNRKVETIDLLFAELKSINDYIVEEIKLIKEA
jgi:hypothetical protein